MRAIRVSEDLTVIPLFQKENATQLLPDGSQQVVTITKAILLHGDGLQPIGVGWSICQPEDKFNAGTGTKRALARALKFATMLSKKERNTVYTVLRRALGEETRPAETEGLSVRERLEQFVREIHNQGLGVSYDVETPNQGGYTFPNAPAAPVKPAYFDCQPTLETYVPGTRVPVNDRRRQGAYPDIGRSW